ncbi:MAG: RNA 2',3'-cyclic phosphodiesterase [Dehalococcoidia bacterium]
MTELPKTLRLFIAVELPGEVRQQLSALQHELQRRGLERLRWARPEGIHVTLKFLGETSAERRPLIEQALKEGAEGVEPHKLMLGKVGRFGSRNAPRVLWVDVAGDVDTLQGLQKRVDERIAPLGFPAETRPFAAHLTLARVPEGLGPQVAEALAGAIEAVTVEPLAIPVREVSLMRSELRRDGAIYTQLFAVPLSG